MHTLQLRLLEWDCERRFQALRYEDLPGRLAPACYRCRARAAASAAVAVATSPAGPAQPGPVRLGSALLFPLAFLPRKAAGRAGGGYHNCNALLLTLDWLHLVQCSHERFNFSRLINMPHGLLQFLKGYQISRNILALLPGPRRNSNRLQKTGHPQTAYE